MKKEITGFWHIDGCSLNNLNKLEKYFGDWRMAWKCRNELQLIQSGIGAYFRQQVLSEADKIDLEGIFEGLLRREVRVVEESDSEYPENLKLIEDRPKILYWRGARRMERAEKSLAVVGTRKNSVYGQESAQFFCQKAIDAGVRIVSGLAYGIDSIAHQTTVKNEVPTWAVIASGILDITPSGNRDLAEKILAFGGAIISEYPSTIKDLKFRYLTRNRLIAGISDATLVVEAAAKSGAIRTGHCALEYGRPLLVVPGEWHNLNTKGCNALINQGGHAILDEKDLLATLGIESASGGKNVKMSIEERMVLEIILQGKNEWQELLNGSAMAHGQLLLNLSNLEIAGIIFRQGEKWHLKPNY